IGPATADHVQRHLSALDPASVGLAILRIDTPGGLDIAMRKIIRAERASPVPVAVYVAPSGARAASAGTYILYAASVAAMAPGTNLGAATPIVIGGMTAMPGREPENETEETDKKDGAKEEAKQAPDEGDAETRKMVNDAVA